jgi:hypothetical protein
MFRKILYHDEQCQFSIGRLGDMRVDIAASERSRKISRDCIRYLDQAVAHYRNLGGSIDASDEGLAYLFEKFIPASLSDENSPLFKIYFREAPERHAAEARQFTTMTMLPE